MRVPVRSTVVLLTALAGVGLAATGHGLEAGEQACVRRLAENAVAVSTRQAARNVACLRDGGGDAQACLAADPRGTLAAATDRTLALKI